MNYVPEIVMDAVWAGLLYMVLTLAQRLLMKRVKVLGYSPIALNMLFLLLSINIFLIRDLKEMYKDAANWNAAALLFFATYLLIRVVDYWFFDIVMKARRKTPVPVVIRDISRWVLSSLTLFIIVRTFFPGINLNVLAVSSIVVSYVLANATQDTLGNLFSGLALNTESPFMIGDWVQIAGNTGRIVDMTWRATCLRTKSDDYIIIPNAAIAREAIINYSRPTEVHGYLLDVGVSYDVPPNKLRKVVLEVLDSVDEVLKSPAPCVWLVKYNDFSVDYKIKFYIRDFSRLEHVQSRIMDLIWYHFKRNDITIPFPIRNIQMRQIQPEEEAQKEEIRLNDKDDMLSGIDIFKPLSNKERRMLAEAMTEEIYAVGENILNQGEEGSSFYIIKSGRVDVFVLKGVREVNVARLSAGSFFGEMSFLTGERCNATIKAGTDCVIEVLSHDVLGRILESNSRLAEDFAVILGEREKSSQDSFAEDNRINPIKKPVAPEVSKDILKRIRDFFSLD